MVNAAQGRSDNVMTPEFRVSFPHCYTPRANTRDPNKPPKYELTAVFPPGTDLSELEAAAHAAVRSKWGDKVPPNLKWPFLDAHAKDKDQGNFPPGSIMLRTSRPAKNGPPPVVDHNVAPLVEADLYGGCYAIMQTNAYCYPAVPDPFIEPGVSFGLNMVQKTRDGEPFAHRDKPEEVFTAFDPESLGPAAPLPASPPQYQQPAAAPQYQAPPNQAPPAPPQYQQPAAAPQYQAPPSQAPPAPPQYQQPASQPASQGPYGDDVPF